jgi:hypothetical protein
MTTLATLSQASRFVHPLLGLFSFAALLAAAACGPVVVVGGGTGGSSQDSSVVSSTSSGTVVIPGAVNALGVPYVLLASNPSPVGGTSGSGGTGSIDPKTLYVKIGNFPPSCAGGDPAPTCTSTLTWQVSIGIPPALQVPGVLQLADKSLISFVSESGISGGSPGTCSGGGGTFWEGTLEIVSIDAGTIVVTLSGTSANGSDFVADGTYVAPICPTGV